jgi:hypothetical protein
MTQEQKRSPGVNSPMIIRTCVLAFALALCGAPQTNSGQALTEISDALRL